MASLRKPTARRSSRETAARDCAAVLDSRFFKALCEPVRVDIVRLLLARGRTDLGTLAAELPQDASVISRHLGVLHGAGIARREKDGRHVFYEVDGPAVVRRLEEMLERFRETVPLCCPGASR